MTLQIKANSWYRTRGGEIAYVAAIVQFGPFVVIGLVGADADRWTISGAYYVDDTNVMDLVEHLPDCDGFDWVPKPKIQLEAGKKYVMANGEVVGPISSDTDPMSEYRFWALGMRWNSEGVRVTKEFRSTHNIVAEYVEPEPAYVPWDFESMPETVRVKAKECGTRWVARPASDTYCMRGNFLSTYKELFDHYVQLDGTPCGRVKQ